MMTQTVIAIGLITVWLVVYSMAIGFRPRPAKAAVARRPITGSQRGRAQVPSGSDVSRKQRLSTLALSYALISVLPLSVSPVWAGEAARLMLGKDVAEQRGILLYAVRSGGHNCAALSDHLYAGDRHGITFFSVRCADGIEYMVSIADAGEMQSRVMMCSVLEALAVHCFRKL